jgi:glycosyltransferase involved in cell wall biosynthesis
VSEPACAFLVSRYPSVTHTFVTGEVRALRAAGVRIETASVRQVPVTEALSSLDREELRRTWALVPPSLGTLVTSHLGALTRSPAAYLATLVRALRMAHAGGRARLWQLFYFGEAMMLWRWMRRQGIHHVHVHHANVSADVALLACDYANRAGAEPPWTWSLTMHGPTEFFDVEAHKLALKIADASAVVCISDFARSQVAALADPATRAKLHTVRCGVDLAAFAPRREDRDATTAEILCVAAMSRRKGHAVLLDAFASVLAEVPHARLTLAGDGKERRTLERRASELGIAHAVRFLGAVEHDRMTDLYDEADVFCLPSFAEGVPVVLMEAMAMEIPVVATAIMGVPELVDDEVHGLLVPPARPDRLAEALVRLLADPALRKRMAVAGRKRVATDYDGTASAAALQRILAPFTS